MVISAQIIIMKALDYCQTGKSDGFTILVDQFIL